VGEDGTAEDMKETEEDLEELEDGEETEEVDGEETEEEEEGAPVAARQDEGEVESSLEELIAKKEERKPAEEQEEEESVLAPEREERLEPLAVKVVPPQPTEFVCANCRLVKHKSQIARREKDKIFCRDCA
jgi:hypothetical protein